MYGDVAQALAATRAGGAFAIGQLETRAMCRANQLAILRAQEFSRCPIEPTPRMRTHVQPRAHATRSIAIQQQRFRIAVQHGFDFMQAVRRQRLQPCQRVGGIVACLAISITVI